MKIKKILCVVLSGAIAAGMLVGCGSKNGSSTAKKDVTLKVLTQRTDIVDTDLKKFGDDYKKKTGVTIKWEAIKDYETDIKVRLNSNDYGDVLLVPSTMQKKDYPNFIEPLGKNTDSKISEYQSNKITAIKDGDKYTVYGLSYGLGATGIVYNKAAFKKAGVDPANVKTLDQFYDACDKIAKTGAIPMAVNSKDKWPLANWFQTAWTFSGNNNFTNKLYKETSIFDESKPIGQAMEVLYTIINKGWTEKDLTTTNWEQSKSDLANAKIAMMPLGTWAIPQIQGLATNKDDIGFMAFPTKDGKTYTLLSPDYALCVSNKSTHKEEAKAFLYAYLDSDYATKNGYIPNNSKLEITDKVFKEFLNSGVQKLVQDPEDAEDEGKFNEVVNKGKIDVWGGTFAQAPALAAKKGKADYDKAMKDLNDSWNNAKKELNY